MKEEINKRFYPKFIFWGTPQFSVYVLDSMEQCGILPDAVVTSPDKPQGRKLVSTPPPVKIWAQQRNIELFQPINLKDLNFTEEYDFFVLAAYGKIIPKKILNIPKNGFINVHPSLLPKLRGPSPIQSSILSGDKEFGVSLIKLDEEMDHGPIIKREEIVPTPINPTYKTLEEKLARMGGKMICDIFLKNEEIKYESQKDEEATYCKKIDKKDGFIETDIVTGKNKDLDKIILAERKVRALNPDPGTFTILKTDKKEIRIKIKKAKIEDGKFLPEIIIPEGRKEMGWENFLKGNKI